MEICCVSPLLAVYLGLSDLPGLAASRFNGPARGGRLGCVACSHSSRVAGQSFLFIFRCKKSKSPLIATDPYSYLMAGCVSGLFIGSLFGSKQRLKEPKENLGAGPLGEGPLRCLFLVLL